MRSFAVINQKGGSGKTTTAVNVAAALAERGRKVLLLDLDSQASASHWYGVHDGGRGLLEALSGERQIVDLIRPTATPGVSLVPSSTWLMAADKLFAGEVAAETRLRDGLEPLGTRRFDYLFMDCPPTLGVMTVNALASAREVLIPVETTVLPLHGLRQLMETIELVTERLNQQLRVSGILACRVKGRTRLAQEIVTDLRECYGELVYRTVIRDTVRLAEAPSYAQPIMQYAPRSTGARDFRALAGELVAQEGKP